MISLSNVMCCVLCDSEARTNSLSSEHQSVDTVILAIPAAMWKVIVMVEQSDRSGSADEPDSHGTTITPRTRNYYKSNQQNEAKLGDSPTL